MAQGSRKGEADDCHDQSEHCRPPISAYGTCRLAATDIGIQLQV